MSGKHAAHSSGSGHDVEHSGWKTSLGTYLGKQQRAQSRVRRWLQNHGIPHRQRRANFPHQQHQREIPRHDRSDDPCTAKTTPASVSCKRIDKHAEVWILLLQHLKKTTLTRVQTLMPAKNQHQATSGRRDGMQEKPIVTCAVGHYSSEYPVWLMYTVASCQKKCFHDSPWNSCMSGLVWS